MKDATSSWWGPEDGKKASPFARPFGTADGASRYMDATSEFARRCFPEFEHHEVREIEADGLGEASWGLRGGTDTAGFAEIGWTRGNAVLAVHVNCRRAVPMSPTPPRRWALAIDEAAQAAA